MAILKTGSYSPAYPSIKNQLCKDAKYKSGDKTVYNRDCRYHKEDPSTIVKWMRRNFGEKTSWLGLLLSRRMCYNRVVG